MNVKWVLECWFFGISFPPHLHQATQKPWHDYVISWINLSLISMRNCWKIQVQRNERKQLKMKEKSLCLPADFCASVSFHFLTFFYYDYYKSDVNVIRQVLDGYARSRQHRKFLKLKLFNYTPFIHKRNYFHHFIIESCGLSCIIKIWISFSFFGMEVTLEVWGTFWLWIRR